MGSLVHQDVRSGRETRRLFNIEVGLFHTASIVGTLRTPVNVDGLHGISEAVTVLVERDIRRRKTLEFVHGDRLTGAVLARGPLRTEAVEATLLGEVVAVAPWGIARAIGRSIVVTEIRGAYSTRGL